MKIIILIFSLIICSVSYCFGIDYNFGPTESIEPFFSVMQRFIYLGFTHILPKGVDHILFVVGLYLLSHNWRTLLVQVTAFTVAHSITLALAIIGIVSIPAHIVEPIIALSIMFIAIENIFYQKTPSWRWIIVFVFGLVHGLGFAGVLSELGLPEGRFIPALIAFNIGVELGQLTVIAIAGFVTVWFLKQKWYKNVIVIPVSGSIACIGLFWTIQRILIITY